MIERLIYVSRAAPGLDARAVFDIARRAHNRNSRLLLTGALLHLDGHFLQVLEGDPRRVRERFERIAADPRHADVQLRLHAAVPARAFPDDWMALRTADELDAALLQRHGHVAGWPADRFDAARLLALLQDCCAAARLPR